MQVNVYALPRDAGALEGKAVVIIDVLRMTTTAVTALGAGCYGIKLVADEGEARAEAYKHKALLGGERLGVKLEGFDFGNSPLEYTRERVEGRRIVMTTSNGARCANAASGARRAVLCSFRNVSAAAQALKGEDEVNVLCAGTGGQFSLDDALCAGYLACALNAERENDLARAMRLLYDAHAGDLRACISGAKHYKYLVSIGFEADIAACLKLDDINLAPELGADGWFIAR